MDTRVFLHFLQALVALCMSPYLYMSLFFVWWHIHSWGVIQRKLYDVCFYRLFNLILTRLGAGFVIGVFVSLVSFIMGIKFNEETILITWITLTFLFLFRLRLGSIAYAVGGLGILQGGIQKINGTAVGELMPFACKGIQMLLALNIPGLLMFCGLLHLALGLLTRVFKQKIAFPIYLQGKRGRPHGAYKLTGIWPVPVLWLVPSLNNSGFNLPWTPLFFSELGLWTFLAFPVIVGFTDYTQTGCPEDKLRLICRSLLSYGAITLVTGWLASFWPELSFLFALFTLVLYEGLHRFSHRKEKIHSPIYVADNRGLKILAVLPHTPATDLSLKSGEKIMKVNGHPVANAIDLHETLRLQPVFYKLELMNPAGHLHYKQRVKYEGEHHQLGLIFVPDKNSLCLNKPFLGSLRRIFHMQPKDYFFVKERMNKIDFLAENTGASPVGMSHAQRLGATTASPIELE